MTGAIAFGGLLILKKDTRGPASQVWPPRSIASFRCGVCSRVSAALGTQQLAPLLWLVAEYAVPVALMVWCLKEETRAKG